MISYIPNFILRSIFKIIPLKLFYLLRDNVTHDEKNTKKLIRLGIPEVLVRIGEKRVLDIFKKIALRIPAYTEFLKDNNITENEIKRTRKIEEIPIMDKETYILPYQKNDPIKLCLDGNINKAKMIETSSGYSGEPTYWFRDQSEVLSEEKQLPILMSIFYGIKDNSAITINGFALGSWVTGIQAGNAARNKTATLFLGLNQKALAEHIRTFYTKYSSRNSSGGFHQMIIMCYPPFLKPIIDSLEKEHSFDSWENLETIIIFGGESFPESYRQYIENKTGGKVFSAYGSADTGIQIGIETSELVELRKKLVENPSMCERLFNKKEAPMIFYYDPTHVYIEEIEKEDKKQKELVFTPLYHRRLPIIRYNLKDEGGVFYNPKEDLKEILEKFGISLNYSLPIVYVFGRSDGTITICAANVSPEQVLNVIMETIPTYFNQHFHISSETNKDQKVRLRVDICVTKEPSQELTKRLIEKLSNITSEIKYSIKKNIICEPIVHYYKKKNWPWITGVGPGAKERYLSSEEEKDLIK